MAGPCISDMTARRAAPLFGGAALLLVLTLGLYWPGYATYDSVVQYGQVLAGRYDDWHPPAMARLWALLGGAPFGTAPMFLLQTGLYWLGLGLLAVRLGLNGRWRAGWATLALGLLPPVLGWQVAVLKDAQMLGAMVAAAGLVAWWRLDARALPPAARGAVALLLLYATLVRANAVFAVAPFAVLLLPRPHGWIMRIALTGAVTLIALAAIPIVNRDLLRAQASGVQRSQAIYDLAGIAVHDRTDMSAAARLLRAERCWTPFYWDDLGEGRCERAVRRLETMPTGALYRLLAIAVLRHPVAYARARLAHLNSTGRWLVPRGWPNAAPPAASEPARDGLAAPGAMAGAVQGWLGLFSDTPPAWPICWLAVGALALVTALRGSPTPATRMATALAASALALEASFAFVSIASDLRYHVWPMLAAGLALVLVAGRLTMRPVGIALALLAAILLPASWVRLSRPPVGDPAHWPVPPMAAR